MMVVEDETIRRILRNLDRPLVMVGLMGSGKTRVGRMLADRLGLRFVDSDEEIEKAAGMTVSEIFEKFGESYFRDGERRVMQRLLGGGVRVIATGGGAVMTPETAGMIWNGSVSIWLRADVSLLAERTSRNNARPLLAGGNQEEILTDLAQQRHPVYEKADITVDSHRGPVEAIANVAIERLDSFLRGRENTRA